MRRMFLSITYIKWTYSLFQGSIKIENNGFIISEHRGPSSAQASQLNSSLDCAEGIITSDYTGSSSQITAPETSASSPPSDQSNCTLQSDHNYPHSRRISLPPLAKDAGPTPRTSLVTSSSRQSINSEASSSGSARFGDEEFSYHLGHSEDESAVSHTQVYNAIDEGHYSNNSEESIPLHLHSSPLRARRSLRIQRRVIERDDSQLDILHLAQPDGDSPWTLSLEPALVNLSEFATGSRTSISVESSSVTHDLAPAAFPELPLSPKTPTGPNSFAVAQSELRSKVGVGRPPHYAPSPSYSGSTIPDPTQKKPLKTKSFYQKMKRFFTPKALKLNESKGISNEMSLTTPRNARFPVLKLNESKGISNDMLLTTPRNASFTPLPFTSPYGNESSSQWSLHRRAFQKTAKSSAPSVVHAWSSDVSHQHLPLGVTQETRRTFEYRPPTPEGGKRNRRFSVPTRLNASSLGPSTPSSSRDISVPSSRPFSKRWSRSGDLDH